MATKPRSYVGTLGHASAVTPRLLAKIPRPSEGIGEREMRGASDGAARRIRDRPASLRIEAVASDRGRVGGLSVRFGPARLALCARSPAGGLHTLSRKEPYMSIGQRRRAMVAGMAFVVLFVAGVIVTFGD